MNRTSMGRRGERAGKARVCLPSLSLSAWLEQSSPFEDSLYYFPTDPDQSKPQAPSSPHHPTITITKINTSSIFFSPKSKQPRPQSFHLAIPNLQPPCHSTITFPRKPCPKRKAHPSRLTQPNTPKGLTMIESCKAVTIQIGQKRQSIGELIKGKKKVMFVRENRRSPVAVGNNRQSITENLRRGNKEILPSPWEFNEELLEIDTNQNN